MIHLVTLNPALDIDLELENPSAGKIGKVIEASIAPGGKAINVARFLRAAKVPLTIWLGTGAGTHPTHVLYRTLLVKKKLKVRFLSDETPIRFNVVLHEKSESKKFNHPGFETHFPHFDQLLKAVKKGHLLVLTGRLPQGVDEFLYASWIDIFNRKGVRTIVDTSGVPLALALRSKPWFFKINRHEISEIIPKRLTGSKSIIAWVRNNWVKKGFGHGAITDGASGAICWRYPEAYWVRGMNAKRPIVVGAGDGFLAGYLNGFHSGKTFKESARLAAAFGAAVASVGINCFSKKDAQRLLKSVRIRRVL